ncbi:class III extradiol dioxygenase subunit B-like domain-containing protein [Rhodococcus sp. 06-235-1A]|uniref:class III extradiol dioxygenase subunit B-like domain-containing protein n=1 Tax=Rhodococcus sp. 06-235-1A TaxID=2022508 RepID=UPI0015C5F60B|nr:class III extradiol dioxygenase subunit B-like domain-containing protein [Rhodococcus sp. 06-235-1A]
MFRAAALVPSPPLLVPELMGSGAAETADLRAAAVDAVTQLASQVDRWMAIGVDRTEETYDASTVGTLRGFGVDVLVSLSAGTVPAAPDPELPLAVLIAGWLRGVAAPDAAVEVRTISADASPQWCARVGTELRREFDASAEIWGVLVLADGANTLTAKAPGSFDERAEQVQQRIDDALGTADVGALANLDADLCAAVGVGGRAAWQVLAALTGSGTTDATELYRSAPFGVGYYVGTWSRD